MPLCLLIENYPSLESMIIQDTTEMGHYILVLSNSFDIFRFVVTLRSSNLTASEFKPIVIMSNHQPSPIQYERLRIFPEIYFLKGDSKKRTHLERAGILKADKVVLFDLSDCHDCGIDEDLVDSANILVFNLIYRLCREAGIRKNVVTCFRKQKNIKYLAYSRKESNNDLSSKDIIYNPVFASGQVLTTMMMESILSSSPSQPYLTEIFKSFCGVPVEIPEEIVRRNNIETSNLCYFAVADEFKDQTFGKLFQTLSETQNIIALGLLREKDGENGTFADNMPFVYTNPPMSLLLKSTDLVYCLAHPVQLS